MSNWESETLEVWQRRKADFEECLEQELLMENPDDTLITVLRDNIDNCIREINVRN